MVTTSVCALWSTTKHAHKKGTQFEKLDDYADKDLEAKCRFKERSEPKAEWNDYLDDDDLSFPVEDDISNGQGFYSYDISIGG